MTLNQVVLIIVGLIAVFGCGLVIGDTYCGARRRLTAIKALARKQETAWYTATPPDYNGMWNGLISEIAPHEEN